MRCVACRRPLTNPVSKRQGYGPDCLKKAVKAGTAPLEALEELAAYQRAKPKKPKASKQSAPEVIRCDKTLDLFDQLRDAALDDLNKAVSVCRSVGIEVTVTIGETE